MEEHESESRINSRNKAPLDKGLPRRDGEVDFERLYQLYSRRIYALCLRMIGNPTEAEDLTQEALLLLFRKVHTFRGDSTFFTWLHRLAANVVLMRLRRTKSRCEESLEEYLDTSDATEVPRRTLATRDVALTGAVDRVDLRQAIVRLPRGFRLVFVLHDIEGYGHSEIAGLLGLSIGTSKSQLHKARLRLRQLLLGPRARPLSPCLVRRRPRKQPGVTRAERPSPLPDLPPEPQISPVTECASDHAFTEEIIPKKSSPLWGDP